MKKTYYTQVVLGTAAGSFNFADDSSLTGKKILGIDVLNVTKCAVAPDGSTVVSAADSIKLFFKLIRNNEAVINRIPFAILDPTQNNGVHFDLQGQYFTWNQSQVVVAATITACTVPMVVYYED